MYNKHERSELKSSIGSSLRDFSEMFSGERIIPKESSRELWNPIVDKDDIEMDRVNRNSGKGRYSWTEILLMTKFEKKEKIICMLKKRGSKNVWLGCIATLLIVDECSKSRTISTTSGPFHLMRSGRKAQTGPVTSCTGRLILLRISWSQTDLMMRIILCTQALTTNLTTMKNRKTFWQELFRRSFSYYHALPSLLDSGTCNMRALATSVIQIFVGTIISPRTISSYRMTLISDMMKASQLSNSRTIIANHTTWFCLITYKSNIDVQCTQLRHIYDLLEHHDIGTRKTDNVLPISDETWSL